MEMDTSIGTLCPELKGIRTISKSAMKRLRKKASKARAIARGKEWLLNHDKKVEEKRLQQSSKGYVAVIDRKGATLTPYSTISRDGLRSTSGATYATGEYRRCNNDTHDYYRYEFNGRSGTHYLDKGRLDRPYASWEK